MVEKTRIEIALLLPNLPDRRDACVGRLGDLLMAKEGVDATHLIEPDALPPERICIHFDPDQLSLGEVRDLAHRAGAELAERFGHLLLNSPPMHVRRARTFGDRLEQIDGVLEAVVSPEGAVRIEFDRTEISEDQIRAAARKLGVRPAEKLPSAILAFVAENTELIFAVLCGGCLLAGWLLATFGEASPWISWTLYAAAYAFGGFYIARETVEKLLARRFEIDLLMLAAAIGAAALGKWAEGALLLFLFSLGHSLEHYAMGRARRAPSKPSPSSRRKRPWCGAAKNWKRSASRRSPPATSPSSSRTSGSRPTASSSMAPAASTSRR